MYKGQNAEKRKAGYRMELQKAEAILESILFTMGDSVEISKLAEVIELDVRKTKKILKNCFIKH